MNLAEKTIIHLHLAHRKYPEDFIRGLLAAFERDHEEKNPDSQKLKDIVLAKARRTPLDCLPGQIIKTLSEFNDFAEKVVESGDRTRALEDVYKLLTASPNNAFGERVALQKVKEAVRRLKS